MDIVSGMQQVRAITGCVRCGGSMVDGERISSAECGKSGLPSMYHSASGLSLTEQAQRDGVIIAPENFYKSKLGAGRIILHKLEQEN